MLHLRGGLIDRRYEKGKTDATLRAAHAAQRSKRLASRPLVSYHCRLVSEVGRPLAAGRLNAVSKWVAPHLEASPEPEQSLGLK
ncbi:MAG TPA: hypothetical protein VH592_13635, partial [Gemmataceae bacterium]